METGQSGRGIAAGVAALVAWLVPSIADAQPVQNSMANKTCRGTFHIPGNANEHGLGGYEFQFSGAGPGMAGKVWRAWGQIAYQKLSAEVETKRLSNDFDGFEYTGELVNIVVSGTQVTFGSSRGAKYDLAYSGGELKGTVDPRGVPGQANWVIANVQMFCQ